MKIISKFHDYYDSGLVYSNDSDTYYVRESKDILIPISKSEFYKNDYYSNNISISHNSILRSQWYNKNGVELLSQYCPKPKIIGFCGKLYPIIMIKDESFFDSTSFLAYIKDQEISMGLSLWRQQKESTIVENFFNYKKDSIMEKVFIDQNVPIFIYEWKSKQDKMSPIFNLEFTLNSELKKYKFYKLFNTFEAYQELSMYVGGVLIKNTNMPVEISNEDRIKQHGFDPIYGFRKMPEKKSQ